MRQSRSGYERRNVRRRGELIVLVQISSADIVDGNHCDVDVGCLRWRVIPTAAASCEISAANAHIHAAFLAATRRPGARGVSGKSEYRTASDGLPARVSGPWAEDKLDALSRYNRIVLRAVKNKWEGLCYIDLLAG